MTYFPAAVRVLTVADTPFAVVRAPDGRVPTLMVNAAGGAVAITLLDPTTNAGVTQVITKTDTSVNVVTLTTPAGVIAVGGLTTYSLVLAGASVTLQSDGTNWNLA